jgi:hypothetical protein
LISGLASKDFGGDVMRSAILLLACGALFCFTACEDRQTDMDDTDETYRESPQTPPTREQGPAERTGRIIDEASRRAAEAVGEGLKKAGKEIEENVPEPREPE